MTKIILASGSPRRRELIELIGYPFEVIPSEYEEDLQEQSPQELVMALSFQKCRDVAERIRSGNVDRHPTGSEREVIVGADTIVVLGNEILGKPHSVADAERMLSMLSGRTHCVYTGVTLIDPVSERSRSFFVKTDVTMYDLTSDDIRWYVDTGEPMDKAGAYGIQGKGSLLVKSINGDYFNVVGLPVASLKRELDAFLQQI